MDEGQSEGVSVKMGWGGIIFGAILMALAAFPASGQPFCEPLSLPALSWAFCSGFMGIVGQLWPIVLVGGLGVFALGVSD